ncbi:MAG: agmatine deiminase [Pseudomonadales bacterium]|nr:agmatine deiminase [Pseudomonadales bacterium]
MSHTLTRTPAADRFWMPAEFEPHAGCWMLWPERPDNWRDGALPAQRVFVEVATAIARFEPVSVGASGAQFAFARQQLPPGIRVVELSHDDCWMRDVGPTFVVNARGERRGVDWVFNAWGGLDGGLYFPWANDDAVARKVLEIEGVDRYRAPFVNEGGAIHVDGQGTALVTEQCLLNRNRNPNCSQSEIETWLQRYLGVSRIIWLGEGVFNDETDGHIDELACFVAPGVVALSWCDNRRDPQFAISHDAYVRLCRARDARGRSLKIIKLPQPGPLFSTAAEARGVQASENARPRPERTRLAGSYTNFYIANGGIVMPLLDPRTDRLAANRLKRAFPDRKVVGVSTREILLGGGNIHCITQQVPLAGRPRKRPA